MNVLLTAALCVTGWLSQYAPGVMERVIATRQAKRTAMHLPAQLPQVDGYIAARDCKQIGQVWTLNLRGESFRVLVADCAGDTPTMQWMNRGNIIGEIDATFAARHGFVRRGIKAEVCRSE